MLAEFDPAAGGSARAGRPGRCPARACHFEDSALMTGAPFELATRYLRRRGDPGPPAAWIKEDYSSFFGIVVGDPRSTMPEIADAIRRYNDVLLGRSGLAQSTLKSLRVSLIQRFLTEQLDYINVAKEVVRITDFHDLLDRIIMTRGSYGKLGGKAAGLLLAKWILETPEAREQRPGRGADAAHLVHRSRRDHGLHQTQRPRRRHGAEVQGDHPGPPRVPQPDPALQEQSSFPPEVTEGLAPRPRLLRRGAAGDPQLEPAGGSLRHRLLAASTRACSWPTRARARSAWRPSSRRWPRSGPRCWAPTPSSTGASGACRSSSRRWAS